MGWATSMANGKEMGTREINPDSLPQESSAQHVEAGLPVQKITRVKSFSPDEWEEFTEEWASSLKSEYSDVKRFAGAGDQGIDIIGYLADGTFDGGWDNYQCKHYDHALMPSEIWVEIGKVIYYTYIGDYPPPQRYYFVAPYGVGTSLGKLLAVPAKLKEGLIENWSSACEKKITSTKEIELDASLEKHIDDFDFSIFSSKSVVQMLEQHAATPFHAVRFGGGLPSRPLPTEPPAAQDAAESRYISQLFEAYGESLGVQVSAVNDLSSNQVLLDDFERQRERFWHAESLRNFARDTVPAGTFDSLKDEVHDGVVDVCNDSHPHGLKRMRAVVSHSAVLSLTSNPLVSVTKVKDKQGICHHLANEDRLTWVKKGADDE